MANEPNWEELFSSERQPDQSASPAPVPEPADDDPFAALFVGLDTGQTPAAPLVYDLQQPVVPAQPQPTAGPPGPPQPNPPQPTIQQESAQPFGQTPGSQPSEYFIPAAPAAAQPEVAAPAAQSLTGESAPSDPFAGLFAQAAPSATPTPAPAQAADPFAALFEQPANTGGPQPSPSAYPVPTSPVAASAVPLAAQPAAVDGAPLTRRELRERGELGASTVPAVPTAGAVDLFASTSPAAAPAAPVAAAPAQPTVPLLAPVASTAGAPASASPVSGASQADVFPFDFGDSGRAAGGSGGYGDSGGGYGGYGGGGDRGGPAQPRKKKRRLLWLWITLPIVLVLGLLGGGAAYAWLNYETQVRELLGWQLPNDYEGTGNGQEVVVTIQSGDLGSDVANTLHDSGVTMTFDAFYDLLLAQPENVNFLPGNYSLQKEMSAQAALDALLDPANKITSKLLITEGTTLPSALEIISETTSIPLADVQAAAEDPTVYGLPATEVSLEGWLFPATYELDGSETAGDILQLLVDTMIQHLDDAGVAPENRHTVLTLASIIQREAGSNQDDFYKIARVFQNRLDQGINLQSDATVAYGTGNLHTVWTTDEERADASNLFNTYANPGLPIGPIGLPGDVAIDAALHPADGPWLFFVPINLATGETVFSETADEHEAAVAQLRAWCDASAENASYCE